MSAIGQRNPRIGRGATRAPAPWPRRAALAEMTAIPFALLAAYGMLRWQSLLPHSMRWRCAALLVLGLIILVLVGLAVQQRRSRGLRVLLTLAALAVTAAILPISGLPLSWSTHVRVAVSLRAIGDGIAALPGVTVPYIGTSFPTRAVIALGGGILIVGSAVAFATSGQVSGVGHRAVAALPLVVLASVPSVLGRPQLGAVHGVLLLLALVALLFWERLVRRSFAATVALVALATLAAIPISAAANGSPWLNVSRLVSSLGPGPMARFNWSQTYGPLGAANSGTGEAVLRVRAKFPAYWKAENLDVFDGTGWTLSPSDVQTPRYPQQPVAGLSRAASNRWTQQLTVSVGSMRTDRIIAAGAAGFPITQGRALEVAPATSPGTWTAQSPLRTGDAYTVEVYTPQPTALELEAAGVRYPVALTNSELGMSLPKLVTTGQPGEDVRFAPYGGGQGVVGGFGVSVQADRTMLMESPYAGVYRLSQRLEAGTTNPYDYVLAVLRYLEHGFSYTKHPPVVRYPIAGFLLQTRSGYCQQFAGAMALLLRMGGVPARVAVGFTTGKLDQRTHQYVVTNKDAHAWDEVWFPKYGWVSFDATPAGAHKSAGLPAADAPRPSRAVPLGIPGLKSGGAALGSTGSGADAAATAASHAGARYASPPIVAGVLLGLVTLLGYWFAMLCGRSRESRQQIASDALVRELEAAFKRCGRPLPSNVTLSAVERRVAGGDGAAAEYVARLRTARFAAATRPPSRAQRRALRAWLAQGMGPAGRLRALLALPPRRLH